MTHIDANDPRLTAYALGEMDPAGRADFEKLLEDSAEGRKLVEEYRSLAGLLSEELASEPKQVLSAEQRVAIQKRAETTDRTAKKPQRERSAFWPWLMQPFHLATVASVCLVLAVTVHWQNSKTTGQRRAPAEGVTVVENRSQVRPGESFIFDAEGKPQRVGDTVTGPLQLGQSAPVASTPLYSLEKSDLSRIEVAEVAAAPPPPAAPAPMPLQLSVELLQSNELARTKRMWVEEEKVVAERDVFLNSQDPAVAAQYGPAPTVAAAQAESTIRGIPSLDNVSQERVLLRESAALSSAPASTAPRMPAEIKLGRNVNVQDVGYIDSDKNHQGFYLSKSSSQDAILGLQVAASVRERYEEKVAPIESEGVESYSGVTDNPFKSVTDEPLSTFSIDVDTASYANVRRFLNQGQLPPKEAVRIEELVNYFPYDYAPPTGEDPFASHVEIVDCPWSPDHRLARIGLKGKEVRGDDRAGCNLVFLIDVSGSMQPENKLPLVKRGMLLLLNQLQPRDKVAIVTYAGDSELALPSTSCENKPLIQAGIEKLGSGGSTNGAGGIVTAYKTAQEGFIKGGVNRVILATDGDFNVGVTSPDELNTLITDKAKSGIFLSVLGFGMGNLKDSTLESLADKGNGNYAYIDTLQEARKVLVEQLAGTLITIAKDVKIQIEFNPGKVGAYRLIGYENRTLAAQDFNDDRKDAGEIGAGHTVTALYEVVPVGVPINLAGVDPLKYQKPAAQPGMETVSSPELFTLKLRYKQPDGDTSKLIEVPVSDRITRGKPAESSQDLKFVAAVASFGMLLRESPYRGTATFDSAAELAREGKGEDRDGYRTEFIQLLGLAKALKP